MKKMSLVALMLLVAGSTAFAAMPASKKVECNVGGKMKLVKSADACKALGGTVVAAKKLS